MSYKQFTYNELNDELIKLVALNYANEMIIKKLEAENKMMRECLEFYAKNSVWGTAKPSDLTSIDPCDEEEVFHQEIGITIRGGKKARETLSKIKE